MKIRATHKTKMGISKVKKSTQIAIFQKKKKKILQGRENYGLKENWCIYCRDEKSETAYAA